MNERICIAQSKLVCIPGVLYSMLVSNLWQDFGGKSGFRLVLWPKLIYKSILHLNSEKQFSIAFEHINIYHTYKRLGYRCWSEGPIIIIILHTLHCVYTVYAGVYASVFHVHTVHIQIMISVMILQQKVTLLRNSLGVVLALSLSPSVFSYLTLYYLESQSSSSSSFSSWFEWRK